MAKRIKWNTNGISFRRGNYEDLVARLNNCSKFVTVGGVCSADTFKSDIRRFAQTFGATEVEIMPLWDKDTDELTVPMQDVVAFRTLSPGRYYIFRRGENPCERIEVQPEEIFA